MPTSTVALPTGNDVAPFQGRQACFLKLGSPQSTWNLSGERRKNEKPIHRRHQQRLPPSRAASTLGFSKTPP